MLLKKKEKIPAHYVIGTISENTENNTVWNKLKKARQDAARKNNSHVRMYSMQNMQNQNGRKNRSVRNAHVFRSGLGCDTESYKPYDSELLSDDFDPLGELLLFETFFDDKK